MRDAEIVDKWLTDFAGKCLVFGCFGTACVALLLFGLFYATTWECGGFVFAISAMLGMIAMKALADMRSSMTSVRRFMADKEIRNHQG